MLSRFCSNANFKINFYKSFIKHFIATLVVSVGCDLPNYDFYGDQKLFAALSKFRLFIGGWGRDRGGAVPGKISEISGANL